MRRFVLICALTLAAQTAFEKGNDYLRAGRLAEAEQAYQLHLKTNPNDPQALANLGAVQARREDYPAAIRSYQRALKAAPSLTPIYLNLGLAHYKSRQWAEALAAYDSFLKMQPGQRQAMQLRALCLLELERFGDAATAFEALQPASDATILIGLATAYTKSGRAADAQKLLGPLLEQGTSPELQLTLGQAYFGEGQDADAMAAFQKARALNPNLPTLGLHIGAVLWRQRKLSDAVAEWRAELARFPTNAEALFTLGTAVALTGGDPTESEQLLRRALAQRPNHARANYQLAKLIWQRRKAPEAIPCLERAVKADPDLREAYYLLGRIYQQTGRKADAQRVFARVKELAEKVRSQQLDLFSEPSQQ
ncbi:MAG: tetratricopeptide repeat protein [Acidobacteria bacterium]|nr:tetratricopeptide repeat protein [Acidobacteriota bacterium]